MSDSITPVELKAALDRGETITVLDVREPQGVPDQPHSGLGAHSAGRDSPALRRDRPSAASIVCQCKSGVRSAKAAAFLRTVGFNRVQNLTGGILAWIDQVDPSQPKY